MARGPLRKEQRLKVREGLGLVAWKTGKAGYRVKEGSGSYQRPMSRWRASALELLRFLPRETHTEKPGWPRCT